MKFIKEFQKQLEREAPLPPPPGADPLDIRQLAGLLRCSVDTARRIPRHQLPAYQVGKRLLFRRSEVLDYLWTKVCEHGAPNLRRAAPRKRSSLAFPFIS